MVGFLDTIKRVNNSNIVESRDLDTMSPAERELTSFKERERQDLIKRELEGFRRSNSMLNDNQGMHQSLLSQPGTLFDTPRNRNIFSPGKNILANNPKRKERNLLSFGGGLF